MVHQVKILNPWLQDHPENILFSDSYPKVISIEKISEPEPAPIPPKVHQHLKKILGLDDFQYPFLDLMNSIEDKLDRLINAFEKKATIFPSIVIMVNAEFIRLFRITGKSVQNWRDEGIIEFSQVKGKIYYLGLF